MRDSALPLIFSIFSAVSASSCCLTELELPLCCFGKFRTSRATGRDLVSRLERHIWLFLLMIALHLSLPLDTDVQIAPFFVLCMPKLLFEPHLWPDATDPLWLQSHAQPIIRLGFFFKKKSICTYSYMINEKKKKKKTTTTNLVELFSQFLWPPAPLVAIIGFHHWSHLETFRALLIYQMARSTRLLYHHHHYYH